MGWVAVPGLKQFVGSLMLAWTKPPHNSPGEQVKKGDLVYDPFVGTGSILVAASYYGAVTLGSDIDARVVKDGKPGQDGQVNNSPFLLLPFQVLIIAFVLIWPDSLL